MISSILFNLALLVVDVLILRCLRRRSEPRRVIDGILRFGYIAAFLGALFALAFGEGLFGTLRLHAWAVFGHGPLLLLAMAQLLGDSPRWRLGLRALAAAVVLVAVYAFRIEPYRLEVTHLSLPAAKLTEPLRIALVADVQTDSVGEYERRAMELVKAEAPDLVLFAGDYVQLHPDRREELETERLALRDAIRDAGLEPRLGCYAVEGNCDFQGWQQAFEGLDVHAFQSLGSVEIGEVVLTGLSFGDSVRSELWVPEEARYHIVLGHAPDFALGPGVHADLLLAGHCHGGQVRIPGFGALVKLSRVPRAWVSGVHEVRPGTTLVTSRGIGLERAFAPQLRFLCRPEVVIIDLVPGAGG